MVFEFSARSLDFLLTEVPFHAALQVKMNIVFMQYFLSAADGTELPFGIPEARPLIPA